MPLKRGSLKTLRHGDLIGTNNTAWRVWPGCYRCEISSDYVSDTCSNPTYDLNGPDFKAKRCEWYAEGSLLVQDFDLYVRTQSLIIIIKHKLWCHLSCWCVHRTRLIYSGWSTSKSKCFGANKRNSSTCTHSWSMITSYNWVNRGLIVNGLWSMTHKLERYSENVAVWPLTLTL